MVTAPPPPSSSEIQALEQQPPKLPGEGADADDAAVARIREALVGLTSKTTSLANKSPPGHVDVMEDRIRTTLKKRNGNLDAAMEDLLGQDHATLVVKSPGPISGVTKALEERVTKLSMAKIAIDPPPPVVMTAQFDFSTPSPDDQVEQARLRQDHRTKAAVVVKPAATAVVVAATFVQVAHAATATAAATTAAPAKKTKAELARDEEDDKAEAGRKPLLSVVVAGHVDAGKSTLMGHLLVDLDYVSQKDLHKFEKESKEMGKASFKYAWVMDEQAEERSRGVTIDVGIKRFETQNKRILLLDAPGHKDFVPNMIAGAAQADAAVLVVPATEGEFDSSFSMGGQTKEHALLLHALGVSRLIVAVNKMDAVNWSEERFAKIKSDLLAFLISDVGFMQDEIEFVACSGLTGENLVKERIPRSPTLLNALDRLPPSKRPVHKPLRIVVADSYKSMQFGPFTFGGKIESGLVRQGDVVILLPGGETATVKQISIHDEIVRRAKAGDNVEIGLSSPDKSFGEKLARPGTVICDPKYLVPLVKRFSARIRTLPALKYPILNGSNLILHIHSVEVPCTVVALMKTIGPDGKNNPRCIKRGEIADVELNLANLVCIEKYQEFRPLGRFLLRFAGATIANGYVIDFTTEGGGGEIGEN